MQHPNDRRSSWGIATAILLGMLVAASLALAEGDHDGPGHGEHEHGASARGTDEDATDDHGGGDHGHDVADPHGGGHANAHAHDAAGNLAEYVADVTFTLETALVGGRLVYVGVGGEIDGVTNPDLVVRHGAVVEIVLVNGDGIEHDIVFPAFSAASEHTFTAGDRVTFAFRAHHVGEGTYAYACARPGHREAGQEGVIVVVAG